MGYKNPNTYSMLVGFSSTAPSDLVTHYFGEITQTLTITPAIRRIYIPRDGHIRTVVLNTMAATVAGSGENIVLSIRINDAVNYAVATVGVAAAMRLFANYNMDVQVRAGDYLELTWDTPAWVNNPTGMRGTGSVLIECE